MARLLFGGGSVPTAGAPAANSRSQWRRTKAGPWPPPGINGTPLSWSLPRAPDRGTRTGPARAVRAVILGIGEGPAVIFHDPGGEAGIGEQLLPRLGVRRPPFEDVRMARQRASRGRSASAKGRKRRNRLQPIAWAQV